MINLLLGFEGRISRTQFRGPRAQPPAAETVRPPPAENTFSIKLPPDLVTQLEAATGCFWVIKNGKQISPTIDDAILMAIERGINHMNDKDGYPLDPDADLVKYHEAGHAVAMFLAAEALGRRGG